MLRVSHGRTQWIIETASLFKKESRSTEAGTGMMNLFM